MDAKNSPVAFNGVVLLRRDREGRLGGLVFPGRFLRLRLGRLVGDPGRRLALLLLLWRVGLDDGRLAADSFGEADSRMSPVSESFFVSKESAAAPISGAVSFGAARPKSGKLESPTGTAARPLPFLTLPLLLIDDRKACVAARPSSISRSSAAKLAAGQKDKARPAAATAFPPLFASARAPSFHGAAAGTGLARDGTGLGARAAAASASTDVTRAVDCISTAFIETRVETFSNARFERGARSCERSALGVRKDTSGDGTGLSRSGPGSAQRYPGAREALSLSSDLID